MHSSPTSSEGSGQDGGLLSPLGSPGVILSPQPQHSQASQGQGLHPVNSSSPHLHPPQLAHSQQLLMHTTPTSRQGTPKLGAIALGGLGHNTPRRLSLNPRDALSTSSSAEALITYRAQSDADNELGQSPKGHPETRKRGWRARKNRHRHRHNTACSECLSLVASSHTQRPEQQPMPHFCLLLASVGLFPALPPSVIPTSLPFRLPDRKSTAFLGLAFLYAFTLMYFCRQSVQLQPSAHVSMGGGVFAGGTAYSDFELLNAQFAGGGTGGSPRPIQQLKCKACTECPPAPPPAALLQPPAPAPTCPVAPPCPAPPPPAPSAAPSLSSFTEQRLLVSSRPSTPSDSQGSVFSVRGRGPSSPHGDEYKLCSFTNVCVQNDRLLLSHSDPAQIALWREEVATKCWKVEQWLQPPICSCFHPRFLPDWLDPAAVPAALESSQQSHKWQHWWSVHKWVSVHHIAHWAQKLIIWQSLFQHTTDLPLPRLDGIVFQDSDLPLSDHESVIFDAVLAAIQPAGRHPVTMAAPGKDREKHLIWAEALKAQRESIEAATAAAATAAAATAAVATPATPGAPAAAPSPPAVPVSVSVLPQPSQLTCFPRLSFTPHYGIFSTHPDDTARFREKVYSRFGLAGANARCPPRKAVMLYRHNRGIVNREEIRTMLKAEFGIELEYATIDETSSSAAQVSLFASTGLMLSSHSSQLINVLFSPAGSAMIEVAPEFYNADFAEYAHGMGIFFQYALGGQPRGGVDQPLQRECVETLSACEGASYCVLDTRYKCKNREYPNKNLDFVANITAVRIAVKNSIQHLNWLCTGRW